MSNVSHIKGARGAMRKVPRQFTDAELLRDLKQAPLTAAERERFYAACTSDLCASGGRPCPTPAACVIDTDSTPPARALRFFARLVQWLLAPKP
jgi:hypothetical protein